MRRTPAQYAADRRRSAKARAKREQRRADWAHEMSVRFMAFGQHDSASSLQHVSATSAKMARCHLNVLLGGRYEDFT